MKKLILSMIFLIAANAYPQSDFQQFLDSVNSAQTDSAKTALIDSFMVHARSVGIPFIEDSTANFIYRGDATSVWLALIVNGRRGVPINLILQRLSNTTFFYYSQTFELDARLEYLFLVITDSGVSTIVDPENPKIVPWCVVPCSELAMPMYVYPEEVIFNPAIPHGTVMSHNIYSAVLDTTYLVSVYLPPGYSSNPGQRFPSLYLNDGQIYVDSSWGATVNVLDHLINQSRMAEIIAVFIPSHSNTRTTTYAGEQRFDYESFIVNTVVTFIDSVYRTIQSPQARGIGGFSFGGLISTQISYNHPQVFGLCAPFSPSYWANDKELFNLIVTQPRKDIKFYLDWGTYETGIAVNARLFRDSLIAKGYQVQWNEWHEGHSMGSWRAHQDNAFEFLFPAEPTSVESSQDRIVVKRFELFQNYPNPFNPTTTIDYHLPKSAMVKLSIYNVAGKLVETLINQYKSAGSHSVQWKANGVSSGTYFFRIEAGEFSAVKKGLLLK